MGFGGSDVLGAPVELDRGLSVVDAALRELAGEGRSKEHAPIEPSIDVVLHHLSAEDSFADNCDVEAKVGLDARAAEVRQLLLRVGEEPNGNDLTDVHLLRGALGVHDDLVGSAGVGHPALDDGDAILVEVLAVDAAGETLSVGHDSAARCQYRRIEPAIALDPLDFRQPGDLAKQGWIEARVVAQRRVVQSGQDGQVRRSAARQVRRKRRLRTPRRGHRAHGQATHQAYQEDEREYALHRLPKVDRKR